MIGMLWVDRSCSSGASRIPIRGIAGWNTRPAVGGVVMGDEHDGALGRRRSPVSAITFQVVRCGSTARRNQSRPPPTSSQTAAAAAAPTSTDSKRRPASATSAEAAFSRPSGHQ